VSVVVCEAFQEPGVAVGDGGADLPEEVRTVGVSQILASEVDFYAISPVP